MSVSDNNGSKEKKGYLSTYPVNRLAPSFELVDLAKEIAKADDMLSVQTSGKLRLLADRIRSLQEEAHKILQETKRNQEIHRADCGFQKKAGQVYHLYRKNDGKLVLSLLSPDDWGARMPFQFEGSFRLENDMTWSSIDDEKK